MKNFDCQSNIPKILIANQIWQKNNEKFRWPIKYSGKIFKNFDWQSNIPEEYSKFLIGNQIYQKNIQNF